MAFALYRQPYSDVYVEVRYDGTPVALNDYESLDGLSGFVIAPFSITPQSPLLLIPAEGALVTEHRLDGTTALSELRQREASADVAASYREDFEKFHGAILSGRFAKLVLARSSEHTIDKSVDVQSLFYNVCRSYPRAMVMLFDTPQSGTWLIASPEILLDRQQSQFCTMALAGTMPYREGLPQWSEKNKAEQHLVEQYIDGIVSERSSQIIKDGPRTVRAGNLMHLRTDFRFRLRAEVSLGQLLSALHPTPAVCGLPKAEAREFIRENESLVRRYYSGFAGPLNLRSETHLYVSLRCMSLADGVVTTYVGGGIMPESVVEDEWTETELKQITYV